MPPSRSLCSRPSAVVMAVVVVVVPSSSSSSPSLPVSRGVIAIVVGGHMAPFTPSRSRHLSHVPCPPSMSRHARREAAGRGRRAYARLGRGISHSRVSSARLLEAVCMSETCLAWPCMSHFCRLRQVDPEDEVSACLSIPHDLRR